MKKGTIICFGDSNTWGFDPITGGRYPSADRWVDIIDNTSDYHAVNVGLNGRQIPHTPYELKEIAGILDGIETGKYAVCADSNAECTDAMSSGSGHIDDQGRCNKSSNSSDNNKSDDTVPVQFWILLGANDIQSNLHFHAEDVVKRMKDLILEMQQHPAYSKGLFDIRVLGPANVRKGPWSDDRCVYEMSRIGGLEKLMCSELGADFTDLMSIEVELAIDGDHFSPAGHHEVADFLMGLL